MARKVKIDKGRGVSIADRDSPDADPHFLKAQLVAEIYRLMQERKLTQTLAAALMGTSRPEVSRLFKGNFREYAVERLMGFVTAFDRDVVIIVRKRKKTGKGGRIIFKAKAA